MPSAATAKAPPLGSAAIVIVENLKRDTVDCRTIYRTPDGKPPGKDYTGDPVDSFTLLLGSQDDNNDEARKENARQPAVEVPEWALEIYRTIPMFKDLERTGHVRVHTPR